MHYTKKLRAALDFRNQDIESLILGESTQTLVDVAATLAYGMRLTPVTFDSFLRGHLTEARLAAEMRHGILMAEADPRHGKKSTDSENHKLPYSLDGSEELPLANPHTDTHETPWAHKDDGKGKTAPYVSPDSKPWALDRSGERLPYGEPTDKKGSDRDARRKALDKERSALDREEDDERRSEMKGSVDREEAAFKPDSDTMQGVKHHADVLVKWLMKFPEAERGKQTQDIIGKLLNAANKMLYDPSRHGGKKAGWGVSAKYKPTTGLDSSAEKRRPRREADTYKMAESFMGDLELEQVVLEGVVLNELKGLINKLKSWFGGGGGEEKKPTAAEINRGKHPTIDPRRLPNDHPDHPRNASWNKDRNQDKTVPLTKAPGGHEDNPVPLKRDMGGGDIAAYSIKGIIDTIKAADISTHGQTTMLQNVVKFLTKQVGQKLNDPKGRQRQEIISGYVDQLLARQKGKREMGMTLDIGKMGKELAADAFKIYKSEFAKRGYDVRIAMNSGRVLDLAITKSPGKTRVDVPDDKRSGSLDATEKWEDTDRTADDEDALAKEIQPWDEAPKGMTIVGALEMNGKVDERNQVATDGKTAALWSRSKKTWVPLDIDKLKLLAKGHKVQGVSLKRKSGASK